MPDAADYCYDFDAADENGHGSMVAGIIAADTGNRIGIAGAASGVKLMPVRFWVLMVRVMMWCRLRQRVCGARR